MIQFLTLFFSLYTVCIQAAPDEIGDFANGVSYGGNHISIIPIMNWCVKGEAPPDYEPSALQFMGSWEYKQAGFDEVEKKYPDYVSTPRCRWNFGLFSKPLFPDYDWDNLDHHEKQKFDLFKRNPFGREGEFHFQMQQARPTIREVKERFARNEGLDVNRIRLYLSGERAWPTEEGQISLSPASKDQCYPQDYKQLQNDIREFSDDALLPRNFSRSATTELILYYEPPTMKEHVIENSIRVTAIMGWCTWGNAPSDFKHPDWFPFTSEEEKNADMDKIESEYPGYKADPRCRKHFGLFSKSFFPEYDWSKLSQDEKNLFDPNEIEKKIGMDVPEFTVKTNTEKVSGPDWKLPIMKQNRKTVATIGDIKTKLAEKLQLDRKRIHLYFSDEDGGSPDRNIRQIDLPRYSSEPSYPSSYSELRNNVHEFSDDTELPSDFGANSKQLLLFYDTPSEIESEHQNKGRLIFERADGSHEVWREDITEKEENELKRRIEEDSSI